MNREINVQTGEETEVPLSEAQIAHIAAYDLDAPDRAWMAEMAAIDAEGMDRFREEMIDSMLAGGLNINPHWLEIHTRKKAKRGT
jgi:hypothetical protein